MSEKGTVPFSDIHERDAVENAPDEQPITGIAYMALAAARPFTFESVHTMAALERFNRFRAVFDDEIDDLGEWRVIDVLSIEAFDIAFEGLSELSLQPPHILCPRRIEKGATRAEGFAGAAIGLNLGGLSDAREALRVGLIVTEVQRDAARARTSDNDLCAGA